MKTREEVIQYFDRMHGVEFDAGEVVYLMDGCEAEYWVDENEWRVYPDIESDYCLEVIKVNY